MDVPFLKPFLRSYPDIKVLADFLFCLFMYEIIRNYSPLFLTNCRAFWAVSSA